MASTIFFKVFLSISNTSSKSQNSFLTFYGILSYVHVDLIIFISIAGNTK